ncbi:glycoside hydrolase family 55 protein [Kitasatospora sp. NBC_01287]|uniref:glycosyl hydrolase family 28-related protein n=1 Tax=Kitasatospora sp. NBC_01287 TaxID=2903573 RepID=UPI00225A764E|nr:glycosyl hydrolase family 28-related protein [Kitasatospora sp. NBC_01287]MCX4744936.1 glycoside hydrolase family 55 protein [Kitasatospora sp. NBC_01287]
MASGSVHGADHSGGGTSRRSILARTVAGAAGLSALTMAMPETPAAAAGTGQGVTDWVNAVTQFGADPSGATDSTSAIQQALNSLSKTGGVVYLPTGGYVCNQARLTPVDGVTLQGAGSKASVVHFDATLNPTLFGTVDTTRRSFCIRDLGITQTNSSAAGTAIDASYFLYSDFTRLQIAGSNIGIDINGGSAYYNWVNWCQITVAGAGAIGIRIGSGSNNNHVVGGRVQVSSVDTGSTGYYIDAKSCSLQSPNCQEGPGVGIDLGPIGVATTITDPYLEDNAVANLRFAAGVLSPTVIGGTIENDTQFAPNIVDNGAISPIILNARTSHGGDIYAHTKAVIGNTWQPEDHGLISWAYDPAAISASSAIVSGTAYFVKLPVRYVTTVSTVWFDIASPVTFPPGGHGFFGLYHVSPGESVATLLAAGSADAVLTAGGVQSVAISPQVVTPGYVYACVMAAGFTGTLALGRNATGGAANLNLPAAGYRFFQNTTGNGTALPASITMSANAAPPAAFWAAIG